MKRLGIVSLLSAVLLVGFALAEAPSSSSRATSLPAAYQKWLDEDVDYIITPEESAKFLTLKDDAERDEFVRQFWVRRDPTPNAEPNEFKQEHYRRIAYSNVHFMQKQPGWRTDRGRTYIVEGPPDEITVSKNSVGMPKETWIYKAPEKSIVFEDRCRCGEYELLKRGSGN